MSVKNICKFEKYGHCKLKEDCKDYHPTEVCKDRVCNVTKCQRRHPASCRYFKSENCRFKKFCKYEHKEEANTDELKDMIVTLKTEIKKIKEKHSEEILELKKRFEHLENKYSSLQSKVVMSFFELK